MDAIAVIQKEIEALHECLWEAGQYLSKGQKGLLQALGSLDGTDRRLADVMAALRVLRQVR